MGGKLRERLIAGLGCSFGALKIQGTAATDQNKARLGQQLCILAYIVTVKNEQKTKALCILMMS